MRHFVRGCIRAWRAIPCACSPTGRLREELVLERGREVKSRKIRLAQSFRNGIGAGPRQSAPEFELGVVVPAVAAVRRAVIARGHR